MPSQENKILQEAFSPIFKRYGYKKHGATWHHDNKELISCFNIQGSQWSKAFYLNLGIYIKALGDKSFPNEYECHVRLRIEGLVDERSKVHQLLDFENSLPQESRLKELTKIVEDKVIPWFQKISTSEDLRKMILEMKLQVVTKIAKEHLGIID